MRFKAIFRFENVIAQMIVLILLLESLIIWQGTSTSK